LIRQRASTACPVEGTERNQPNVSASVFPLACGCLAWRTHRVWTVLALGDGEVTTSVVPFGQEALPARGQVLHAAKMSVDGGHVDLGVVRIKSI
jgi:hypothetical protein